MHDGGQMQYKIMGFLITLCGSSLVSKFSSHDCAPSDEFGKKFGGDFACNALWSWGIELFMILDFVVNWTLFMSLFLSSVFIGNKSFALSCLTHFLANFRHKESLLSDRVSCRFYLSRACS